MRVITRQRAREFNLPLYYTGEPCHRGHLSFRNVVNRGCRECVNEKRRRIRLPSKARLMAGR